MAKDGETTHVTFCRMLGNIPWPKFHFHSNCPLFPLRSVFRTSNLNWLSFRGFAPFLKQSFGKVVFWQTKTINCGFYYDLSHIVGLKNHSYLSGNNLVYPHTAVGFSTPSAPRISFCLPFGICVGEGILIPSLLLLKHLNAIFCWKRNKQSGSEFNYTLFREASGQRCVVI